MFDNDLVNDIDVLCDIKMYFGMYFEMDKMKKY